MLRARQSRAPASWWTPLEHGRRESHRAVLPLHVKPHGFLDSSIHVDLVQARGQPPVKVVRVLRQRHVGEKANGDVSTG